MIRYGQIWLAAWCRGETKCDHGLPGGSGIGLCESAPQGKWRESSPTPGNHAAADHSVRRSPLTVARMPRLVIRIRTRETRPSHDHVWSEREAPPKEASESDAPPIERSEERRVGKYRSEEH